jgi:hypothetical protein
MHKFRLSKDDSPMHSGIIGNWTRGRRGHQPLWRKGRGAEIGVLRQCIRAKEQGKVAIELLIQKRMGTEEEMRRRSIARMQEEEMVGDGEAKRRMDDGSVSTVEAFVKGFGEMEKRSGKGKEFPI